jgi:hypothetical protein
VAVWNRLRAELDRAGRAAQQAIDEGKIRLDIHRARASADQCAQRLGYAVYRAQMSGRDLPAEEYARLSSDVTAAEGEVARLTGLLDQAQQRRSTTGTEQHGASSDSASSTPSDASSSTNEAPPSA